RRAVVARALSGTDTRLVACRTQARPGGRQTARRGRGADVGRSAADGRRSRVRGGCGPARRVAGVVGNTTQTSFHNGRVRGKPAGRGRGAGRSRHETPTTLRRIRTRGGGRGTGPLADAVAHGRSEERRVGRRGGG